MLKRLVQVGDMVIYKDSNDAPPRFGKSIHPAVVTATHWSDDGKTQIWVDLTVFFHGWSPAPVMKVPRGTQASDSAVWWERGEGNV